MELVMYADLCLSQCDSTIEVMEYLKRPPHPFPCLQNPNSQCGME